MELAKCASEVIYFFELISVYISIDANIKFYSLHNLDGINQVLMNNHIYTFTRVC